MNHGKHGSLIYSEETFQVRGAVFEVYRTMGPGFLEAVYQECLCLELAAREVPFLATPRLALAYKGRPLEATYSPDLVCFDRVVVELKAARELAPEHRAQLMNYLQATGHRVGLLVNFGASPRAQVERFAL